MKIKVEIEINDSKLSEVVKSFREKMGDLTLNQMKDEISKKAEELMEEYDD